MAESEKKEEEKEEEEEEEEERPNWKLVENGHLKIIDGVGPLCYF